jgi:hypothetical protein
MKTILVILMVFSSTLTSYAQETIKLDEALKQSAVYFASRMPEGAKIAVSNITVNRRDISDYIIDDLSKYLIEVPFLTVVDRLNLETLQTELNFQMSGTVSDETAQSIGRNIGAQAVISGSLELLGNMYRIRLRAIKVETAEIFGIYTANISKREIDRIFKPARSRIHIGNPFAGLQPFTQFYMLGFDYHHENSPGFTIGAFGLYMTMNFYASDWSNFYHVGVNGRPYSMDGTRGSSFDDTYQDKTTYSKIDWLAGCNLNIIPERLYIPVGIGMNTAREYRLFGEYPLDSSSYWYVSPEGSIVKFEFEAGILLKVSLGYITVTYRNIGLNEHSFSLGMGFCISRDKWGDWR